MGLQVVIDVGYTNLGVLAYHFHPETFDILEILMIDRVDISRQRHLVVSPHECKLHHSSMVCDHVAHFIQEYKTWLDAADEIAIEQQPPGGLQAVEQLLVSAYRDKTVLVSPVALHSYLGIRGISYTRRKDFVEREAEKILKKHPAIYRHYKKFPRRHDMADTVCIALYRMSQRRSRRTNKIILRVLSPEEYRFYRARYSKDSPKIRKVSIFWNK
jgi:hypothetical protein